MAVSLKPKFTKAEIRSLLLSRKQRILDAIQLRLQFIGENFVADARSTETYKDRTGNLRGSIGYVILYNGAQISGDLEGTVDGVRFMKKAIAEISRKYKSGFVLIGVAGMDYAAAVESLGYDVITSSATRAADNLRRGMKRIQESIKNQK